MHTLKQIFIYPIKGLPGISCETAMAMPKGLRFDRRFMLVTATGDFISQRQFPILTQFSTSISEDLLMVKFSNQSKTIRIPLSPMFGRPMKVKVWDDVVWVFEPDEMVSNWFSDCLQMKCHLVFMPEKAERMVDPTYTRGEDTVSFADAFPYLLVNTKSLELLNSKLPSPISINRFRPNFIIEGIEAFEEDNWSEFLIGDKLFRAVKPCARCQVVTIDQRSGIGGAEPLKTLATFRTQKNKVLFGENSLLHGTPGLVQTGMKLTVMSFKKIAT